jgi:hypothetical protein
MEATADDDNVEALRTAFDTAAAEYDTAADELERCKTNLADAERRQRIADENPVTPAAKQPAGARGAKNESVYREDTPERSFFTDAYAMQFNHDTHARERLEAHGREMLDNGTISKRDVGTGAFAGLTVPQYLIDLYAPLARAGAPLLSAVRKLPLPDKGMTVNVSRITTGAAAAAQPPRTTRCRRRTSTTRC